MDDPKLPAGSEFDSRAPWNGRDLSDLCRYCDSEHLKVIAEEEAIFRYGKNEDGEVDEDKLEEVLDEIRNEIGLCKTCFSVEQADFDRDDY
jgi:hypothetical protein